MATASSSSPSSVADAINGCLVSLITKSDIRYEGVLDNINHQDSSIFLRDVHSFGTEGRKMNGPQIPPNDRVYEVIVFRQKDIKDFQVKSSPPAHPNYRELDLQSHCPCPGATYTSFPSAVTGSLTNLISHTTQLGLPWPSFLVPLPLYIPGGNIGSWIASPPVSNAYGGGVVMPIYWQGYYGAPIGHPQLHQQSLLRPPLGLSMDSSMQQPRWYPNFSSSSLAITSNLPPALRAPALSSEPSITLPSEVLPVTVTNKAPDVSTSRVALATSLPSLTPLTSSGPDINSLVPPISSKPNAVSGSSLPYQVVSQLSTGVLGSSNSIRRETPAPALVTPGQLLKSGPTKVSSAQPMQTPHKDGEVVQVSPASSPEPCLPVSAETVSPILPLAVTSGPSHKPDGSGRGRRRRRGRGILHRRPATRVTENGDFMATNENFKNEVWGHLGKSNKSHSEEKDSEENTFDEDCRQDEDNGILLNVKPAYNKDDFFDSLSSSVHDNSSQNGRTSYSEQIKIDTETFGNLLRHRGGRGGHHRGGRTQGDCYGRGRRHAVPNNSS